MQRTFWTERLDEYLAERNVAWISGVRRVGKTTIARMLPGAEWHDCELASVRRTLEDPEAFLKQRDGRLIILDEIHRLSNPSEVLKIAADHFPRIRLVATGSSTLAARLKFRDTLTGRKREMWLTPMIFRDLVDFGMVDIERRMLHGGLPPFFLADRVNDHTFEEWMTSYWAKDLSELFHIEKRAAFMKFAELLFAQSGQLFEAQAFAAPCEISRPTVQSYLEALETTLLVTVVRPYSGASAAEIKSQPKVYGFDTGFVAYHHGWEKLRDEDRGLLLEHLVLNELVAHTGRDAVYMWRDKQQHEVDFIVRVGRKRAVTAVECKVKASKFDPSGLLSFRRRHPDGPNFVVTLSETDDYVRRFGGVPVRFLPFAAFAKKVAHVSRARVSRGR